MCPLCGETFTRHQAAPGADVVCPRCKSGFSSDDATTIGGEAAAPDGDAAATVSATSVPSPAASPSASAPALPEIPGYTMLGQVARGGMAIVMKAHHAALDRVVAIKVPLPRHVANARDRERFLREARSAARLRHPNICPIYEVGSHGDLPYIAMGYIEGATLRDWAKRTRPKPYQAAQMVARLARAVGYAHTHGVVHRDIKPANVMVDAETGEPILMDFGLAKELAEQNVQMTRAGQFMGTPAYMAPEQAAGRTAQIGPRTDVYALGAVLYELLCDRPPFLGTLGELLHKLQHEEPASPRTMVPHLHRDLETICLKALAKEPAARYESAVALAEDLDRFCSGETILARRSSVFTKVYRKIRRRPTAAAAILVALVVAAAAAAITVRATRTYKVAAVGRAFESALDASDCTAGSLKSVEARVDDLARLDPEQGQAARKRLYDRFAGALAESFKKPHLEPKDAAAIEETLAALQTRAPDLVPPLRKAFKDRLRRWVTLFTLAPPFANLDKVFGPSKVTADATALVLSADQTDPLVRTRVPVTGHLQLEAEFADGWQASRELGLLMGCEKTCSYTFVLRVGRPTLDRGAAPLATASSFAAARDTGDPVVLEILKNGVCLKDQVLPARSLPEGKLRLVVMREEGRLSCQINDKPPMATQDAFPLPVDASGVCGLRWPKAVRLVRLVGSRQDVPPVTSPLERGDALYAERQYGEALKFYRDQALASDSAAGRQESRYKEGLCLQELHRDEQASGVFEALAAETGDPWPAMAACQLYAMRLRQGRFGEAESVCTGLATRYRFEQLAAIVPEDVRTRAIEYYRGTAMGFGLVAPERNRAEKLARVLSVNPMMGMGEGYDLWSHLALARVYRMEDKLPAAKEVLRRIIAQIIADPLLDGPQLHYIIAEYCWLLTEMGESKAALEEVDRHLMTGDGQYTPNCNQLILERARLHAVLGQWEQAEKELQDYYRATDEADDDFRTYSRACLMDGFLRQRKGDVAGALAVWKQGAELAHKPLPNESGQRYAGSGMGLLLGQILIGLSDQVTEGDFDVLLDHVAKALPEFAPGVSVDEGRGAHITKQIMRNLVPIRTPVIRDMWRSPRGRELARRIAFREASIRDCVLGPATLFMGELMHQVVFADGMSADQEEIVWNLMADGFKAFEKEELPALVYVWIFATLKGNVGPAGWKGVQASVPKNLRGPLAYVFGVLYVKRNQRDQGIEFFRSAIADTAPDSKVARLAQDEIGKLGEKPEK